MRGRHLVGASLGLSAAAGLVWLGAAVAGDPTPAPPPAPPHPLTAAVAAGRHVRIDGPRGAIHAWIPAGYRAETAATVIYVHGYFDTADSAWTNHKLPEQFALSALNAMFIVPEAPVAQKLPVNYPDLTDVIRRVEDEAGVVRGQATTIALGHSGAYRTLETWLDEPLLDQLVLVDANYGEEEPLLGWVRSAPQHRLIMVGEDTTLGTESLARALPETVTLDRFPATFDLWPAEARAARLLYVRAQYGHMPLVTNGMVLPALLRVLPVELLADGPWREPLGALPTDAGPGADARR